MNVRPSERLKTPRVVVGMLLIHIVPAVLWGCHDDRPAQIPNGPAECPQRASAAPTTAPSCSPGGDVASACKGLRRASCVEGDTTPEGHTCEELLTTTLDTRAWPLACWASANVREDVLKCGKARCPKR